MRRAWFSVQVHVFEYTLVATFEPAWKCAALRPDRRFWHLSLGPVQVSLWRWPERSPHRPPDPHRTVDLRGQDAARTETQRRLALN